MVFSGRIFGGLGTWVWSPVPWSSHFSPVLNTELWSVPATPAFTWGPGLWAHSLCDPLLKYWLKYWCRPGNESQESFWSALLLALPSSLTDQLGMESVGTQWKRNKTDEKMRFKKTPTLCRLSYKALYTTENLLWKESSFDFL